MVQKIRGNPDDLFFQNFDLFLQFQMAVCHVLLFDKFLQLKLNEMFF